jgi:hypothetical protein
LKKNDKNIIKQYRYLIDVQIIQSVRKKLNSKKKKKTFLSQEQLFRFISRQQNHILVNFRSSWARKTQELK